MESNNKQINDKQEKNNLYYNSNFLSIIIMPLFLFNNKVNNYNFFEILAGKLHNPSIRIELCLLIFIYLWCFINIIIYILGR